MSTTIDQAPDDVAQDLNAALSLDSTAAEEPVQAASPTAAREKSADEQLEESIFDDETASELFGEAFSPRKSYIFKIEMGGTTFYCVPAPKDILGQFQRRIREQDKARVRDARALQQSYEDARAALVEREAGEEELAALDEAHQDAASQAEEAQVEQMERIYDDTLRRTVRDWHNPKWPRRLACNDTTLARVATPVKAALFDEILIRSKTGRAASAFLGPSTSHG